MAATPIWFGSEDRPLFGWFHSPDEGRARVGVVICAPFGLEYIQAHYALRLLAERLCSDGACVLRFDYDGMGDSAGSGEDPDRVEAWLRSVAQAIEVVRKTGVLAVSLVGMRIGATLAAKAAADDGDIEQIVLWDPCLSGGSFLHEGRAVSALSFGIKVTATDRFVDTPGFRVDSETATDLRSMSLSNLPRPPARRALVLTRSDRNVPTDVLVGLGEECVECIEATGQADLMDRGSPYQVLPRAAIAEIGSWMAIDGPGEPATLLAPAQGESKVVGRDHLGRNVVETPFYVAPIGLFAIRTEVPDAPRGPTALFLSVANEHRIGPARLWVDLARRWAGYGIPSLRIDLSGLGDSPLRHSGQAEFVARAPEAFADVMDAAQAACPEDPSNVVLVGLCASGYQAIDSAFDLAPRGVLAINPVLSFVPPEYKSGLPLDPRRRAALPKNSLVEAFHNDGPLSPLRRRFPDLGWWLRLVVAGDRRPGSWLTHLGRNGVSTLVVAGEREWRPIRLGSTRRTRSKWAGEGMFRFAFIPELQHGLLVGEQRQHIFDLVTQHAVDKFAPAEVSRRLAVQPT